MKKATIRAGQHLMEVPNANPRRGLRWREPARQFYDRVNPPCVLSDEQLDAIFADLDANYDALSRGGHSRAELVGKLRSAAEHPEMNEGGRLAYTIRHHGKNKWLVMLIMEAIEISAALEVYRQAVQCARRQQRYFLEALAGTDVSEEKRRHLEHSSNTTIRALETAELIARNALADNHALAVKLRDHTAQVALPRSTEAGDDE